MSNDNKKNDELDVFMVRFLDFLTDALNDPAIIAKNTPLVQTILVGLDLVTKNPQTWGKVKMKPADMKLALKAIGDKIDSLQTQAQIRLKIATTQQEMITADEEMKEASALFDVLANVLKNQNESLRNAASNVR
jgi:hypothetical protein